jgi:ABC-type polysaccharide/polyol phosphate transport system ATPase subunit
VDRVQLERVSKVYRLGQRTDAREALSAAIRRGLTRRRQDPRRLWSLKDVSFRVADGESLGIIGRNGAGKSTVLKILTRITTPTSGVARTRGRVAALLEAGTGFHPELTGRENVFLNGSILGMSSQDIRRRFDQIIDFSGVERFVDTPVKRYSSGMSLRLAFAVAAHLEPDVLLVDEILAVGDAEFQRKCVGRMAEVEREGRSVLFVSHDLTTLARLCPRSLWIDSGQIRYDGATGDVVREYLASGISEAPSAEATTSCGPLTVRSVRVVGVGEASGMPPLLREDPVRVQVLFDLAEEIPGFDLAIYVTTANGVRVFDETLSDHTYARPQTGRYRAEMTIPPMLNVGDYTVGVWFGTTYDDIVHEPTAASFTLHGSDQQRPGRIIVLNLPISLVPVAS